MRLVPLLSDAAFIIFEILAVGHRANVLSTTKTWIDVPEPNPGGMIWLCHS